MPRHEIVVSAENNHYMVWQAMLFHFSCVKHLGRPPIVVVHKHDEPLLPGFERIRASGGIVQTAPNYRDLNGILYPPRNTAGSLRHVETDADFIVLCDPDMLFLQPLPFDDLTLTGRQVSFDFVGYLAPEADVYQPTLDNVCRAAGLAPEKLRHPVIDGGVPHVIPTVWQQKLSDEWFELMELFPTIGSSHPDAGGGVSPASDTNPHKDWLATMWAVVMAMHRLNLEPVMTGLCVTNCQGDNPLPPLDATGPKMLHFCYGGPGFDKRRFGGPTDSEVAVWNVPPDDGTIGGAIRHQLREARQFYGLSPSSTASHSVCSTQRSALPTREWS